MYRLIVLSVFCCLTLFIISAFFALSYAKETQKGGLPGPILLGGETYAANDLPLDGADSGVSVGIPTKLFTCFYIKKSN
jgi:hypothetical protein